MQRQYNSLLLERSDVKEILSRVYETMQRFALLADTDRGNIRALLKKGTEKEAGVQLDNLLCTIQADIVLCLDFIQQLTECHTKEDIEQLLSIMKRREIHGRG